MSMVFDIIDFSFSHLCNGNRDQLIKEGSR